MNKNQNPYRKNGEAAPTEAQAVINATLKENGGTSLKVPLISEKWRVVMEAVKPLLPSLEP